MLLFSPIDLSAESVQSASLALEGVDHVHRSDRLALRVLAVRHSVTNHVLQEHLQFVECCRELSFLANLEHTTSFLVDESGDALDAAATSETADGRLKIEKLGQSQNFLHLLDLPW